MGRIETQEADVLLGREVAGKEPTGQSKGSWGLPEGVLEIRCGTWSSLRVQMIYTLLR